MPQAVAGLPQRSFLETRRRDVWWATPATVFIILSAFVVYTMWAAAVNEHYEFGPYLSPLYSPLLFGDSPHAWFKSHPTWWPWSAAFLILWVPANFRFTCYYYRGAYYKAFWADPPSCTVGEPRKSYWGEQKLPLVLQNIHRYFLFLAIAFLFFLAYDVWKALWFTNPETGATEFGIGVGTIVLAVNVVLLSSYTLGCHALRHVVGGRQKTLADKPVQRSCYTCVGALNRRHMLFAWLSLFGVAFSDIYVRLCSMGVWHDLRLF